jgi:L-ascorbate metabolism protein UlaG (beta-lactamase superfamily)
LTLARPQPARYTAGETTGAEPMHALSRFNVAVAIIVATAGTLLATAADAACLRNVAQKSPLLIPAAFGVGAVAQGQVGITYVGHASFLIETAGGVKIVTDYNDYVRAPVTPDIVTMNNAHTTHYSMGVEAGVAHALQGWGNESGPIVHDLPYQDVHVRNVPTNVRDFDRTRYNGNSIFVFETAQLCIAHLGHLHHRLTREHLTALGEIDVLMVPVDGSYTLNIEGMIEVIEQIRAPLIIPMHFFSLGGLERFLGTLKGAGTKLDYAVEFSPTPSVVVSRETLPRQPQILVLPGR